MTVIRQEINMDKAAKKKTFSKILVAINDSSKTVDRAINYATRIAKDKNIDLIVVGPSGRSKLKSLVLGSVTSDVVRLANCPVLTIK
jgi:nucleotide-binding universal stress UspA family protein